MSRAALLLLALATFSSACGGSASESPWPVRPINTEPGPEGEKLEQGNVVDVRALPTAKRPGAKATPSASPSAKPSP